MAALIARVGFVNVSLRRSMGFVGMVGLCLIKGMEIEAVRGFQFGDAIVKMDR